MQVFDEVTRTMRSKVYCRMAVVDHIPGNIIYGYVDKGAPLQTVFIRTRSGDTASFPAYVEGFRDKVVFSNRRGVYISTVDFPEQDLLAEIHLKGMGHFPYRFNQRYEAIESFRIFKGKQKILNCEKSYKLSEFLRYSFGLEFETSQGYVPEDLCFRDGLIPLRDGSISGVEYSTVVLNGNDGIALLEQQLQTLDKYTNFNKECSLHIHFGGFPLDASKLFNLYALCKKLEGELMRILPEYTFNSAQYKANQKDYCRRLNTYRNFNQMYEHLVGTRFFNDFTQPHPNDLGRQAKWRIPTRYYWVNFINALCYDVNKTIEFRFLRPTYNFQKIILWMYILNAILCYADTHMNEGRGATNLNDIIRRVYPRELADRIILGVTRLIIIKDNQSANNDLIGQDLRLEEEMFSVDLGIS